MIAYFCTLPPSSQRRLGSRFENQAQPHKAGFQLAPALRSGLAGMTILAFASTANACDRDFEFYTDFELTLLKISTSDVVFEGIPTAIIPLPIREGMGAIETTFTVNHCLKGNCGSVLKIVSQDLSKRSDCDDDSTRIFKESFAAKKEMWVAAEISTVYNDSFYEPGERILYSGSYYTFAIQAKPNIKFREK